MSETPPEGSSGGFTVHRRLHTSAKLVYAAFVEPRNLEQWFVVPGYHTPADRMRVDARPGGRLDAVMISDTDGTEIPFGFTYAELDPPHRVVLRFDEPRELVTVTLADAPDGDVDLTYEFVSWPGPADPDASRRGVDDMLDLIEAGIERGTIHGSSVAERTTASTSTGETQV
ncbi:SRPBCC domain-containing protein [Jiangella ureilytica]|uniref:SRPBCC domain-containing protein n=1 Tax=Jiangella ureilytica TaxID=2530374 RepID=A0A4R4RWH0_9ACTN|nr:SRPBCC domain-containing protein [Jiangella ureilytica]TDC53242.1 SRPBCC domain-containing protein [Jiangella ureilytica]